MTAVPPLPFPERNTVVGEVHSPRYQLVPASPEPEPPSNSSAIPPSELTPEQCPAWVLRILTRHPDLRSGLSRAYREDHLRQYGPSEDQPRAA